MNYTKGAHRLVEWRLTRWRSGFQGEGGIERSGMKGCEGKTKDMELQQQLIKLNC